jgi:hypothetical protein
LRKIEEQVEEYGVTGCAFSCATTAVRLTSVAPSIRFLANGCSATALLAVPSSAAAVTFFDWTKACASFASMSAAIAPAFASVSSAASRHICQSVAQAKHDSSGRCNNRGLPNIVGHDARRPARQRAPFAPPRGCGRRWAR